MGMLRGERDEVDWRVRAKASPVSSFAYSSYQQWSMLS